MLFVLLIILFVLVCFILCFLILIQSDKGGGISGALGGGLGGANSLLGTQDTANILTRGTILFTTIFFLLCILLSFVPGRRSDEVNKSLLKERAEKLQSFSPSSVLKSEGLPVVKGKEEEGTTTPSEQQQNAPAALPILPSGESGTEQKK